MAKHALHREMAFSCDQLFDLVADVEHYPEFVPWWSAARIRRREGDSVYYTDQVIRMSVLSQRFTSKTVLYRPREITVTSEEKPFRFLDINWKFAPIATGAAVDLSLEFHFKSATLSRMMRLVSDEAAHVLISAFEDRAHHIYGRPQLGLDGVAHLH